LYYYNATYVDELSIDDVKKDFENISKMKQEYADQINHIEGKIADINAQGICGHLESLKLLDGMRSNLLYAYKGIVSNYNAVKERLERMEKMANDPNNNDEARDSDKT